MLFTSAEIASMRAIVEELMDDSAQVVSAPKTAGTYGGFTSGTIELGEAFPCKLVTKRTGKETEEESRIFARADWLLRFPYEITLREGQRLLVAHTEGESGAQSSQTYEIRAIVDVRTEPHLQNLAGLQIVR